MLLLLTALCLIRGQLSVIIHRALHSLRGLVQLAVVVWAAPRNGSAGGASNDIDHTASDFMCKDTPWKYISLCCFPLAFTTHPFVHQSLDRNDRTQDTSGMYQNRPRGLCGRIMMVNEERATKERQIT